MTEFVLKNNYFKFSGQGKQQISGTAIGTKLASTYSCIFIDDIKSKFLENHSESRLGILMSYSLFRLMGKKNFSCFLPI